MTYPHLKKQKKPYGRRVRGQVGDSNVKRKETVPGRGKYRCEDSEKRESVPLK